jgi:prolyl oligopeptidase
MRSFIILSMLIAPLSLIAKDAKKQKSIQYPTTNKIAHTDTYFGTIVEDPYQWLEDDTSAQTTAWVEAQNKVTFDYLNKIPYKEQLKERYKELYDYAKLDNPLIVGDYVFFEKKEGLQNQPIIYVQKGLQGKPVIFINPNDIDAKGLSAVSITGISKDNKYINISIHKAGSDWSEMYVYDIATKSRMNDKIEWIKNAGADWDENGFFYSRYPKPAEGKELSAQNEYNTVYYHKLGNTQEQDELVYRDNNDPLTYNGVSIPENGQYIFLYKFKGTYGNELLYKKTNEAGWNFKPLFSGYKNAYYLIDVVGEKFLIHTDDGASNKQLVLVDPANADFKNWKKIIPENKEALLEGVYTTGGKLFAKYLQNATNKLFAFDIDGNNRKEIALPGTGEIDVFPSKQIDQVLHYTYTSFNYPKSIFTYNVSTGYSNLFMKPDLKFNPDDYESKQVWYKSKDGTKVSMFIVNKKGLVLNGKNPTFLYGYGGFNINMSPGFSASRILLLENGGVFAMPNLRGGGEYGDDWHKAGVLMKKQNVFDDFIAAAQYLIKQKYTSKQKLAIAGGSNGGLLVGACMTQKPDLFKVAFPAVGVMDMLKFHKFTVGHAWVVEYGSSEQSKEMFEYLKGYSPYHNIKPNTKYPATMVTTADHDDRVVPAHSFKFAARLQEYNVSPNPMLIRIGVNAGHGAGKPTSKIIEEEADKWSFFFWNLGYKVLSNK